MNFYESFQNSVDNNNKSSIYGDYNTSQNNNLHYSTLQEKQINQFQIKDEVEESKQEKVEEPRKDVDDEE